MAKLLSNGIELSRVEQHLITTSTCSVPRCSASQSSIRTQRVLMSSGWVLEKIANGKWKRKEKSSITTGQGFRASEADAKQWTAAMVRDGWREVGASGSYLPKK